MKPPTHIPEAATIRRITAPTNIHVIGFMKASEFIYKIYVQPWISVAPLFIRDN
jgi:hypothetical protein